MRATVLAVLFAAAMNAANGAAAADQAAEDQHIRDLAARYAKCVVVRSHDRARQFVLGEGDPPINGGCLVNANRGSGGRMRFFGDNYRYALADALIVKDFPSGVPASLKTAPMLTHAEPKPFDESLLSKDAKKAAAQREAYSRRRSVWLMDVLGDCIVRADPTAVYALVRNDVGSAAEHDAFEAIKPAIGGCLPGDATFRLNPGVLRGSIALNLYRLAVSVRAPDHA